MELEKKEVIRMYTQMLTIRRFEERIIKEFHAGNLPGIVHSYIGEEAIAVGVCANLRADDRIVSHHRGHGHCIAKGADIRRMMAEIYGKKTGYCKGKGGSMHIADFKIGMLGADGIVGAGLPIAVGAALACHLEQKQRVTAVFFGDGACQEGEFHECLNLAGIWKLPIVFVCENNQWAVNTPASYALAAGEITRMPEAYHIPATMVDGNDLFAVYRAAKDMIQRTRNGGGPGFIEYRTFRWRAHFESSHLPDLRPKELIEEWKKKCPVKALEKKLLASGILNEQEMKEIDGQVMLRIQDAVDFALDSPLPAPEDALEGVYSA
jgi:TPP-dependent pyruvate/acetoin dehydrogenase alpha subunit